MCAFVCFLYNPQQLWIFFLKQQLIVWIVVNQQYLTFSVVE